MLPVAKFGENNIDHELKSRDQYCVHIPTTIFLQCNTFHFTIPVTSKSPYMCSYQTHKFYDNVLYKSPQPAYVQD